MQQRVHRSTQDFTTPSYSDLLDVQPTVSGTQSHTDTPSVTEPASRGAISNQSRPVLASLIISDAMLSLHDSSLPKACPDDTNRVEDSTQIDNVGGLRTSLSSGGVDDVFLEKLHDADDIWPQLMINLDMPYL